MPAPVTQMIIALMKAQLNPKPNVWEVEVPRFDGSNQPINPQPSGTPSPSTWPVITVKHDGRMMYKWNMGCDPYDIAGAVLIEVHGTSKAQVQAAYDPIEALWAKESNWKNVGFLPTGDTSNPFYIIQMMLKEFGIGQVESERLGPSLLYFRGELLYNPCQVHGAISTQS